MRCMVVLSALLLLASPSAVSQCGLAGVVIEEVPIPADLASQIAADAGFVNEPKCWRVYLCFLESGFRVTGIYTPDICEAGPNLCWTADCPDCTGDSKFYQHPFGSFFGHLVPGAAVPFEPLLAFDSWWSIGEPYDPSTIGGYSLPDISIVEFETEGGAWNPGANASILTAAGFQDVDAQRRVLIGQFTTDGTLSGSVLVFYGYQPVVCPETGSVGPFEQLVVFSTDPGFEQTCACDLEVTPGCVNSAACNYDPLADCETGYCILPGDPCDDGSNFTVNDTVQEDCSCLGVPMVQGCTSEPACNYNPDANSDDGSCFFVGDSCNDGSSATVNDTVQEDCSCAGVPAVFGCTEEPACNYNPDANVNNGTCVFIGDPCDDADPLTINDSIKPDCSCSGDELVEGCTDPLACNFNEIANADDASCTFAGDPCDDEDETTVNDSLTEGCECEGTVGIAHFSMRGFTIYPVPARDQVVIEPKWMNERFDAVLHDQCGRSVLHTELSGRTSINLENLATGTYLLVLSNGTFRHHARVVVLR